MSNRRPDAPGKRLTMAPDVNARLAWLAALVAIETPEYMHDSGTCYVRRALVWQIRRELQQHGYDWKMAHRMMKRLEAERNAARKAARKPEEGVA
jgi:hypothetical protein